MHEAAERAARGAVLERQLHLDQPEARAMGVDRHSGLHPESSREWHDSRNYRGLEGALARDRCGGLEPGRPPDRPAREAERRTETAAQAPGEGGHREVALVALERLHEARQVARRRSEV